MYVYIIKKMPLFKARFQVHNSFGIIDNLEF